MGFIEESLMPGEKVIYRAKLHWIFIFWPCIWLFIGIVFLIGMETRPLGIILTLFSLLWLGLRLIIYNTSEFGVTDQRVLMKTGFVKRTSLEILLKKVEMIQVNQSILGRMLDYGTIMVGGTGGTKNSFPNISIPLSFRQNVQNQTSIVQEKT
jgi:uncharacterized membrane protein YdbT with pleckstrin-like domain